MNSKKVSIVSGYILEEESVLTLAEFCQTFKAPAETIIRMVDYGVITPIEKNKDEESTAGGNTSRHWSFHRSALIRADKALRLKYDLGINLAGAALALDLLDEIQNLRTKLNQVR